VKFVLSAAFNDPGHLIPLAAAAEECGFAAMSFPDHVVHPEKLGGMVEHRGRDYAFERLEMSPAPPARIPIWVGGISDPALRRAARHDGWLSDLQTSAEIAACIAKLRAYRSEQGRSGEPFDVMASASDAFTLDGYRRLGEAGVTHVLTLPWVFYHGDTRELDLKLDGMRRFAEDVLTRLG